MSKWSEKIKDWDLDVPLRIKKLKLTNTKSLNEQNKSDSDMIMSKPIESFEMQSRTIPNTNIIPKMCVIHDYSLKESSPQKPGIKTLQNSPTLKYPKTYSRKMQRVFLESSEEISDELEDYPDLLSTNTDVKNGNCKNEAAIPDPTEGFLFSDNYLDNSDFSQSFHTPDNSPLPNSSPKAINGGYQRTRKNLKQQITECRKLNKDGVFESTTVETGTSSPSSNESGSETIAPATKQGKTSVPVHKNLSPVQNLTGRNEDTFNYRNFSTIAMDESSKTVNETHAPLFPDTKTRISISKNVLCKTSIVSDVQSTSNNITQSRNQPSLMDLVRQYSENQSSLQNIKSSPKTHGTKRNSQSGRKKGGITKKAKKEMPSTADRVQLLAKADIKTPAHTSRSKNYRSKDLTLIDNSHAMSLRIKGICDASFNSGLKISDNLSPKPDVCLQNESAESDQDNQMAVLGLVKKGAERRSKTSKKSVQERNRKELEESGIFSSYSPKKNEIDVPKRKLMLKTGLRNRSLSTDEESGDTSIYSLSNRGLSPSSLKNSEFSKMDHLDSSSQFKPIHVNTNDPLIFQMNGNSSSRSVASQSNSFHMENNYLLEDRVRCRGIVSANNDCMQTSTAQHCSTSQPTWGSIVPFINAQQNCAVFPIVKSSHLCPYPVLIVRQECGCAYFNASTSECNHSQDVAAPYGTRNCNMNTAIVSSVQSNSDHIFKNMSALTKSVPCEISEADDPAPETDTDSYYIAANRRTCKSQSSDFFCTVLQKINSVRRKCYFECSEENVNFFTAMPFASKISVRTFCDNPEVMNVLLEILEELPDFDHTASENDYEFPSDFKDDHLCNIVKDYVDHFITNFISGYLENMKNSQRFSSNSVLKFVYDYLQPRECVIFSYLFAEDSVIKMEELVARIAVAALLVIFIEFRQRETVDSQY